MIAVFVSLLVSGYVNIICPLVNENAFQTGEN